MKRSSYMIGIAVMMLAAAFAIPGLCAEDASAETDSAPVPEAEVPGAEDAGAEGGKGVDPTSYKVEYKIGDKTIVSVVKPDNGATTLATLEKLGVVIDKGIDFVAWDDGATQYNAGSTYVYGTDAEGKAITTVTMTAVFKPVVYTAQFLGQDGTILKTVNGTVADAQGDAVPPIQLSAEAPVAPKVTGYIFAGWAVADGEPVAVKDLPKLTENITFRAVYTVDWKVIFIDGDKTYTCVSSKVVIPNLGTREGFTFLGWFIETEQIADPAAYKFVKDTTFNAKWEPINCFVTFKAGEFEKTVPVLYGETVAELALPEGYSAWDFDFTAPITGNVTIAAIEAEAPEPGFFETPTGKCVIILGVFLAGLILYKAYPTVIAPKLKAKGGKKE